MSAHTPDAGRPDVRPDSPFLSLDTRLPRACRGCGGCCRHRQDLLLSGYDLFRISRRLALPPAVAAASFCLRYVGEESRLPLLRMRTQRENEGACVFLTAENRCSIHTARPLACALFPLGQSLLEEKGGSLSARYFSQQAPCQEPGGPIAVLGDFLMASGVLEREPIDIRWAQVCLALSQALRQGSPHHPPLWEKLWQRRIFHALYENYDTEQAYLPQLERHAASLLSSISAE